MKTTSRHPAARARRKMWPSWPSATQWQGNRSSSGPAKPRTGNSSTSRPPRLTASATASGRLPPPQMIASGPSADAPSLGGGRLIGLVLPALIRPAQGSVLAFADEGDDLHHGLVGGEFVRGRIEPFGEIPGVEEELAVGTPQRVDPLA